MTELSDYKRLVERPMIEEREKRIAALVDQVQQLRDALIQVRGFANVMSEDNWRDLQTHIKRQCAVLNAA